MKHRHMRKLACAAVAAVIWSVVSTVAAHAAVTRTWIGNGSSALWSTTTNWSPAGPPATGDDLVFPETSAPSSTDDIPSLSVHSLSLANGASVSPGSGVSLTVSGDVTVPSSTSPSSANAGLGLPIVLTSGTHTVTVAANQMLGLANASGAASLVLAGTGEVWAYGSVTIQGTIDVRAGLLVWGGGGSGPGVGPVIVETGATLAASAVASDGHINGTGVLGYGALQGSGHIPGRVFLDTDATIGNQPGGYITLDGAVSGPGRLTAAGTDSSQVILSANNTYTGGTSVTAGTLTAGSAGALGSGAVTVNGGSLVIAPGVTIPNAVSITGLGVTVPPPPYIGYPGPIGGAGALVGGNGRWETPGGGTDSGSVTLPSGSTQVVGNPDLTLAGQISGPGELYVGAGTVTLAAQTPNSYTGGTRVRGGAVLAGAPGAVQLPGVVNVTGYGYVKLAADSQTSAANAFNVSGGLALDGHPTTIGSLLVSGGGISLGRRPQPPWLPTPAAQLTTLTVGSTDLEGGYYGAVMDAAQPSAVDRLVTGSVKINDAILDINLDSHNPIATGSTVTIIENTGPQAVLGTFHGLPEGGLLWKAGDRYRISYVGGDGNDVTLTRLPETGYWMVDQTGHVYAFGAAPWLGGPSGQMAPGETAVHLEPTLTDRGYWVVGSLGHVYSYGDAQFSGGSPALRAGEHVVSLTANYGGTGYWLFTDQGRVFPYGGAPFYGDMSATHLNGPVLASISTPTRRGYYMVASDGGIFSFGDAVFYGSMGGKALNGPVVGLAPTPSGSGYWLVATDGGTFSFGDAGFHGSMGGKSLNRPVIGMVAYGDGYLMVGSDGGIFDFSNKAFVGSLGANPPQTPVVGVTALV